MTRQVIKIGTRGGKIVSDKGGHKQYAGKDKPNRMVAPEIDHEFEAMLRKKSRTELVIFEERFADTYMRVPINMRPSLEGRMNALRKVAGEQRIAGYQKWAPKAPEPAPKPKAPAGPSDEQKRRLDNLTHTAVSAIKSALRGEEGVEVEASAPGQIYLSYRDWSFPKDSEYESGHDQSEREGPAVKKRIDAIFRAIGDRVPGFSVQIGRGDKNYFEGDAFIEMPPPKGKKTPAPKSEGPKGQGAVKGQAADPVKAAGPSEPAAPAKAALSVAEREKLETDREMYLDVIEMMRESRQQIPPHYHAKLAEIESKLAGETPGGAAIAGGHVFGHPSATTIGGGRYSHLIPVKATSKAVIKRRQDEVQKHIDELQVKIGKANASILHGKGPEKRKAQAWLNSANGVEAQTTLDMLRNETAKELLRMASAASSLNLPDSVKGEPSINKTGKVNVKKATAAKAPAGEVERIQKTIDRSRAKLKGATGERKTKYEARLKKAEARLKALS